jgi:signal peptidase I
VPADNVIGKARFIVWPPSRWGGAHSVNPQQNR